MMNTIKSELLQYGIPFEENVSLKKKTWIKTGGIVSLWITPKGVEQLKKTIVLLKSGDIEFELVGHTSNLYYLNNYNPKVIISTRNVSQFVENEDCIECACGAPSSSVSRYCVERGYTGYSGLVNLPGTVGAAIHNNSSCFDCSISEHLIDCVFYDLDRNEEVCLNPNDFDFAYRTSKLKKKELRGVLLSLRLDKKQGVAGMEIAKAARATQIRKTTQETSAYTLGSVYAGLIPRDNVLAKMTQVGGGENIKNV